VLSSLGNGTSSYINAAGFAGYIQGRLIAGGLRISVRCASNQTPPLIYGCLINDSINDLGACTYNSLIRNTAMKPVYGESTTFSPTAQQVFLPIDSNDFIFYPQITASSINQSTVGATLLFLVDSAASCTITVQWIGQYELRTGINTSATLVEEDSLDQQDSLADILPNPEQAVKAVRNRVANGGLSVPMKLASGLIGLVRSAITGLSDKSNSNVPGTVFPSNPSGDWNQVDQY